MSTSSTSILRKEYDQAVLARRNYERANLIFDLNDADTHYIQLCIRVQEAYRDLKKSEESEFRFNSLYLPVINRRLQNLREKLSNLQLKGGA